MCNEKTSPQPSYESQKQIYLAYSDTENIQFYSQCETSVFLDMFFVNDQKMAKNSWVSKEFSEFTVYGDFILFIVTFVIGSVMTVLIQNARKNLLDTQSLLGCFINLCDGFINQEVVGKIEDRIKTKKYVKPKKTAKQKSVKIKKAVKIKKSVKTKNTTKLRKLAKIKKNLKTRKSNKRTEKTSKRSKTKKEKKNKVVPKVNVEDISLVSQEKKKILQFSPKTPEFNVDTRAPKLEQDPTEVTYYRSLQENIKKKPLTTAVVIERLFCNYNTNSQKEKPVIETIQKITKESDWRWQDCRKIDSDLMEDLFRTPFSLYGNEVPSEIESLTCTKEEVALVKKLTQNLSCLKKNNTASPNSIGENSHSNSNRPRKIKVIRSKQLKSKCSHLKSNCTIEGRELVEQLSKNLSCVKKDDKKQRICQYPKEDDEFVKELTQNLSCLRKQDLYHCTDEDSQLVRELTQNLSCLKKHDRKLEVSLKKNQPIQHPRDTSIFTPFQKEELHTQNIEEFYSQSQGLKRKLTDRLSSSHVNAETIEEIMNDMTAGMESFS